jgi:hypothetical protein
MRWQLWVVTVAISLNAGWMTFDGLRALIVGDYVTPRSGLRAGQLGPWSKVVQMIGLDPRSPAVKVSFVLYGIITQALLGCVLMGHQWARTALLISAVIGLVYVPAGTVLNAAAIAVLIWLRWAMKA